MSIQRNKTILVWKHLDDDILRFVNEGADSRYLIFIHEKLRRLNLI